MLHPYERRSISRRGFLCGSAVGVGAGLIGGAICYRSLRKRYDRQDIAAVAPRSAVAADGLGRLRGRVVEVHDPRAVNAQHRIDRAAVRQMLDRGMCRFTGADHAEEAWKSLFTPGEVIGIKVNPVGHNKGRPQVVGSISSFELVLEVVRNLRSIGVRPQDIVLFERYASEFIDAGYEELLRVREMEGVRWAASGAGYSEQQLAISGVDVPDGYSPELLRHVAGYDPDQFVHMGFAAPSHSQNDDRRFRSHLSTILTRMVDRVITLPVLKDHRSAGVTLSLKNMSHGMNNNVARSHLSGLVHGYPSSPGRGDDGPNQCNTFIPAAVNQPTIRNKAMLHIMDGLIAVYEGGPGNWNESWGTWRANRLLIASDPVALDHIGWDLIDTQRTLLGLPRVGEVGRLNYSQKHQVRAAVAALAGRGPVDTVNLAASAKSFIGAGRSEAFDRRTPEHVILAGLIGLGEFDLRKISHLRETI